MQCNKMLRSSVQQTAARCRPAAQAARCRPVVQATSRRSCRRLRAVSSSFDTSQAPVVNVYVLPKPAPVSKIIAGQAAAEAAQQELMTSGRLAEVATENELLHSILTTYSTMQQLYHKALRPFLELHPKYTSSPAGFAYAICCELLGRQPEKRPGDSISLIELQGLYLGALNACMPGQEPTLELAHELICIAELELAGPWHTLPDLLACLATKQLSEPDSNSKSQDGILSGLSQMAGQAAWNVVTTSLNMAVDKPARDCCQQLLISSCTLPEDPIPIMLNNDTTMMDVMVWTSAVLRSRCNYSYGDLMDAALGTLAAADQLVVTQAELEHQSWTTYAHAQPLPDPRYGGGHLIEELRRITLTAAFSNIAYTTMMTHLGGRLPMDEWGTIEAVTSKLLVLDPTFQSSQAAGWIDAQTRAIELAQAMPALRGKQARDADVAAQVANFEKPPKGCGEPTLPGIMLANLVVQSAFYRLQADRQFKQISAGTADLALGLYSNMCSDLLRTYIGVMYRGDLEALDAQAGGFGTILYWLEIQDMALRKAGGQPGPAAEAAAQELIRTLPHSVVLTRPALRCASAMAANSYVSVLPLEGTALIGRELRASIIARGSRQLAAEVQALGKLTAATEAQALTAFATIGDSGGSGNSSSSKSKANTHQGARGRRQPSVAGGDASPGLLSVQDAADKLFERLMQSGSTLTRQAVAQLLCNTGSPGDQPLRYQPALTEALSDQLNTLCVLEASLFGRQTSPPPWLAGALLQHSTQAVAGKHPKFADALLGTAPTEKAYIRPIADFLAAKRKTASVFTEAVCRVGWSLDSQAAAALATSWVLHLCDSPDVRLRGFLWAAASIITSDPSVWQGDVGQDQLSKSPPGELLIIGAFHTVSLARTSDSVAGAMPRGFDCVENLLRCSNRCINLGDTHDSIKVVLDAVVAAKAVVVWLAVRKLYSTIQLIIQESGGSFSDLEPAMQALVQAATGRVVTTSAAAARCPAAVSLLEAVPLLQGTSYSFVINGVLSGPADWKQKATAFAAVWAAAVAAATDSQLAATPAFGCQRPDIPWLLQALPDTCSQLRKQQLLEQCAPAVLSPVLSAAQMRLSEQAAAVAVTSTASSPGKAIQEASQLLDAACALLCDSDSSKSLHNLPYKTVLQPYASQLLSMLQKHPELPPLPHLLPALCMAVSAGVAAGDSSILEATEQQLVASTPAGGADIAQLHWAAVAGAAAIRDDHKPLLQYWASAMSRAVPAGGTSSTAMRVAVTAIWAAVVADAAKGGNLTQQLLAQPQALPDSVMAALLQAALQHQQRQSGSSSQVLQQLLALSVQQEHMQALPADLLSELLTAALCAATQPAAAVSLADCLQLLQRLLSRRAAGVKNTAAQQLVTALGDSSFKMQQFEQLVLQLEDSDMATGLLCSLLQQACIRGAAGEQTKQNGAELSWRLFLLLRQCSASVSARVQKQLVKICSKMLVQLDGSGTADAADRALQVWQYYCVASGTADTALQQLSSSAQAAVVSALAAAKQDEQALSVVTQAPQLLPHLAQQWQQRTDGGTHVDVKLLLQALQLCVATASGSAAAADIILQLPPLQQQGNFPDIQGSQLAAQVVQLLCSSGSFEPALKLLPACVCGTGQELTADTAAVTTTVARVAVAIMQTGTVAQQQELLQVLIGSGQQQLLQSATSQCLAQAAPAAVGLLLRALQHSNQGQTFALLLQPQQLEQLCELVCASSSSHAGSTGSNSSSSTGALPTVEQLAHDCAALKQLSGAAAAQLLNALCRGHPELQPSAAAAALGVVGVDIPPSATDIEPSSTKPRVATVAALCFNQLAAHSEVGQDSDALDAALSGWVSQLSPEAAAAALLAAGLTLVQPVADAPAGVAVPVLCHRLYKRAKATGDRLVFDLGLVSAAETAALDASWGTGEGIIAAAEKALQHAADSTKGSRNKHNWVPLLPTARTALLTVLVHTEGVEAAGKLLLSWKEDGGQPGHGHAAAAGRKGRAAGSALVKEAAWLAAHSLLSLPLINSFLAAAVSVVSVHQQEGENEEAEAAAQAALQVALGLFKQQLLSIAMGAAGPVDVAAALPGAPTVSSADVAAMFACLAQLHGAVADWQQMSGILAAAAKQQLVGVQADDLQVVLAGAAAALNAAGRHVAAVQLLDGLPAAGVTAVSQQALARQLLAAAEEDDEAWQELSERLAAGDEDIIEGLSVLSAAPAPGGSLDYSTVPVLLNSQHQSMPLQWVLAVAAGKQ